MAESDSGEWIDLTSEGDEPGALLKKVLVKGKSPYGPQHGMEVKVHYDGTLTENGEKFDSSIDRGEHYKFKLGEGKVIKGWRVGVPKMRWGEKSILRCRKDYAYGDEEAGPKIPAGATLDFEVELFTDFTEAEGMLGIQKFQIGGEQSWVTAKPEGKVWFEFAICDEWGNVNGPQKTTHDMDIMEENTFELWPEWIHECLMQMGDGQVMLFGVDYDSKYTPCEWWNLPKKPRGKKFYFRVNMTKLSNPKDLWQMDADEKMEEAKSRKDLGNAFFKEKVFTKAVKHYKKGANCLQSQVDEVEKKGRGKDQIKIESLEKEFGEEFRDLYCSLYANLSMAYIKQKIFDEGRDAASKVLNYEPEHLKALARRAQCRVQTADSFGAREDCTLVLKLDPDNKYCQQLNKIAGQRIKAYEKKKQKMAAKMFS